jgi:hypothetical protein
MTPQYIYVEIRRPSRDGTDPGAIEEGWFIVTDDYVHLCDRDDNKVRGEFVGRPISPGETAREVAVRMLRARVRSRPAKPFNRPKLAGFEKDISAACHCAS